MTVAGLGVEAATGGERGAVLVAALGVGLVLAVAAVAVATRTVASVRAVDAAVAREEALHAAETVATLLIDRLFADDADWVAPDGPDPVALGHGWRGFDAALAGLPVPAGPGEDAVRADVAIVGPGPTLRVRTEARMRGAVRAVAITVRPASTADLAWATVHAVEDPLVTGGTAETCGRPRWADGLLSASGPVEPEVSDTTDVCVRTRVDERLAVEGPVHLDDAFRMDAAWTPGGPVTTAAPAVADTVAPIVLGPADATAAPAPWGLTAAASLRLPDDPFAALGGVAICELRGPTLLRLDGADVRVRSPRSRPEHDGNGGPPVRCPWLDRSRLDDVVVMTPPDVAAIVVRSDLGARCGAHPLGLDPAEDAAVEAGCRDGTAYVWGTYAGRRSVLAEDDVQLVWDVVPDTAAARLGLVAGRGVVLRRPVGPPLRLVAPFGTDLPFAGPGIPPFGPYPADAPTAAPGRWAEPRVVAAVAALGGGFRVQNPRAGQWNPVPVVLEGSLAQRFDGPLGSERRDATGALQARTGRPLTVRHDAGLAASVPPALPRLRGGAPRVLRWEEVRPDASGPPP